MRKEMKSMKRRRIAALISSVMVTVSATFVTAFASSAVSRNFYYSNNIDAYVHGYVDFLEGPLWITDKVWCTASLEGPDWPCVSAEYTLRTDKTFIAHSTLSYKNRKDSFEEKSAGHGGSYAVLKIQYDNKEVTLKTK